MPWRPALLKGNRVLARCDEAGAFLDEGGRVEVRYRPTDPRAYRAGVRNLSPVEGEILPDDHCVPAAPEAPDAAAAKTKATGGARKTTASASAGKAVEAGPSDARYVAYTDGACSGNPGPAGLGVVLLEGNSRRELSEYLGTATNNVAELTAILRALEVIEAVEDSVLVHTDSQYAIGVLQKGWKPKVNQELIAAIKTRMKVFKALRLVYVPGHAGVPLNERADQLARMAVSSRSNSPWRETQVGRERAEA
ncbi:MAG: ribonuclease H [Myxococcales bacterium]